MDACGEFFLPDQGLFKVGLGGCLPSLCFFVVLFCFDALSPGGFEFLANIISLIITPVFPVNFYSVRVEGSSVYCTFFVCWGSFSVPKFYFKFVFCFLQRFPSHRCIEYFSFDVVGE